MQIEHIDQMILWSLNLCIKFSLIPLQTSNFFMVSDWFLLTRFKLHCDKYVKLYLYVTLF